MLNELMFATPIVKPIDGLCNLVMQILLYAA